jgi:hypothetical protein
MLTHRVVSWVNEHVVGPSPWSPEVQTIIDRYAPDPDPVRVRQSDELALVVAHSLLVVRTIVLWVLAAFTVSKLGGNSNTLIYPLGVAATAWCLCGLALHLARYYGALISLWTHQRSPETTPQYRWVRWPRASSDLDFVAQAVIAAAVTEILL